MTEIPEYLKSFLAPPVSNDLLERVSSPVDEQDLWLMQEALCDVVKLHIPTTRRTPCPDGIPGCAVAHFSTTQACSCGFWRYPCPTAQAIKKRVYE